MKVIEEKDGLPELSEGQTFNNADTVVSEHFTQPPKHFTEDSLLSAMERAGVEETNDDAERKGLGTSATRAAVIEKLVLSGFIKRKGKQLLPTADGVSLISVLPDDLKTPLLTAEWENGLTLIANGEASAEDFMQGIEKNIRNLVIENNRPIRIQVRGGDK